jgi:hypothetical protein
LARRYFGGGMVDELSAGINPAQYVAGPPERAALVRRTSTVERVTRQGAR